jgi:hypothetical protein
MQEKGFFKPCHFSHRHRYHSRYFYLFRCQPLLHQSPIRIKAVVEVVDVQSAPPAFRGPENLRFQAVSNGLFQVSWLLTSPLVAHGVGSKDVDNCYEMLGGAAANQASWFSQPQCRFTAPASSYVKIFSGAKSAWSLMM